MNKIFTTSAVSDWWLEHFTRLGYKFESINDDHIIDHIDKGDMIIVWETQWNIVHKNIDRIKKAKDTYPTFKIIVAIDHSFRYKKLLHRIDEELDGYKETVSFCTIQHMAEDFKNVDVTSIGSNEYWCQHDIAEYVINNWIGKRKPHNEKDNIFLFLQGMRMDKFRKELLAAFKQWSNNTYCYSPIVRSDTTGYNRIKDFEEWSIKTFDNKNMFGGFGNGPPRFDYYDKAQVELVVETNVEDDIIHFSEKVWRPIACKMPFLLIAGSMTLQKLLDIGYKLEPLDYYEKIIGGHDDKISLFFNTCDTIIKDNSLIKKMEKASEHNHNHFWNTRPKLFWPGVIKNAEKLFGYCKINEVYERLLKI
jgi:hypothetical protein